MSSTTRIFARILGPFLLILGAAFATGAITTRQLLAAFADDPALMFLAALFMLTIGLVILAFHGAWSPLSAALISFTGWFLTMRGVIMLFLPGLFAFLLQPLLNLAWVPPLGGVLALIVGGWLTAIAYARPLSAESPTRVQNE